MSQTAPTAKTELSPSRLNYAAALRGVAPRPTNQPFTFAQLGCPDLEAFLGLAASNPEGQFFALLTNNSKATEAQNMADRRRVDNVVFVTAINQLPQLDYLVFDAVASANSIQQISIDDLLAAAKLVKPSGLLAHHYKAYKNGDESLRFLVNAFVPEMDADQSRTFLHELRDLGSLYFTEHPINRAALEKAILDDAPESFFATCAAGDKAGSLTYDMQALMNHFGFSFAGNADIAANYLELSVPATAHEVLLSCREHLLYESIKDFAMQRLERYDIWCREPVEQTSNLAALFGGFNFGITLPVDEVPTSVKAAGNTINLAKPPYAELIRLMTMMPISIGDFLEHSTGNKFEPAEIVSAVHILVATGLALPMRSSYQGQHTAIVAKPKWSNGFNDFLNATSISSSEVSLASPVLGGVIHIPARDALVIQAIIRGGMEECVASLLPELHRIASDPVLSAKITNIPLAKAEPAHAMVIEVLNRSLVKWYTYGLLAA